MEKWIICDIDGTLLNHGVITDYTKKILVQAQEAGYRLFLASGRSPYTMRYFVEELQLHKFGGIGICFNGSIIYDFKNEKVLHSEYIAKDELKKCIEIAEAAGLEVAVYSYDKVYCKKRNPQLTSGFYRNDDVYKDVEYIEFQPLSNLDVEAQKLACVLTGDEQYQSLVQVVKDVNFIRVHSGWMEKSPNDVNKGIAILKIMALFNQTKENIYAFGDGENDIAMFKVVGHPIAMENGFASLKKYAKDITKSNVNDGVAYYVEKYLLNNKK